MFNVWVTDYRKAVNFGDSDDDSMSDNSDDDFGATKKSKPKKKYAY